MASVADLEKQCEEQGEKVKTLKGSGAGPDAVKAEVAQLLVLKGTLIELLEKEIAGSPANKAELEAKLLKARPLTKGKDKKKETKVAAPTEQTAEQKAKAAAKAADKDAKKAARKDKKSGGGKPAEAPKPDTKPAAAAKPASKTPAPVAASAGKATKVYIAGNSAGASAVRLAAALCKVAVVDRPPPASNGAPLTGCAAIEVGGKVFCGNNTALAFCCSSNAEYKPAGALEAAQVQQWLSFCTSSLSDAPAKAGAAHAELNSALLLRTFLAGDKLSAADLAVFAAVHPMIAGDAKGRQTNGNLNRWFEHVQYCTADAGVFTPVQSLEPDSTGPPGSTPAKPAGAGVAPGGSTAKADKKAKAAADKAAAKAAKKDKKTAAPAGAAAAAGADNVSRLDIRVGLVVKAEMHPDSEKLYLETIDLGDAEGPRTILSGLKGLVPLEEMQGRRVVCVCNLKPAKLAGIESHGMVLCASYEPEGGDKVCEPMAPPEGAAVGELIKFEGHESNPDKVLKKSKVWTECAESLMTNSDGIGCYKGVPMMTSAGPCFVTNKSVLSDKHIK